MGGGGDLVDANIEKRPNFDQNRFFILFSWTDSRKSTYSTGILSNLERVCFAGLGTAKTAKQTSKPANWPDQVLLVR